MENKKIFNIMKFNKNKKYFIFIDIDGTLSPFGDQISPHTIKVINALTKKGHKCFLVTGRSWSGTKKIYKMVNLKTPVVIFTGSMVMHPNDNNFPVQEFLIDLDTVKKIAAEPNFKQLADALIMNVYDKVYMDRLDEILYYDCHCNHANQVIIGDIANCYEYGAHNLAIGTQKQADSERYIKGLEEKYSNLLWRKWTSFRNTNVISVSVKTASKSFGIKMILDYYNKSPKETIAFGDGGNDVDMLECVEYGIKMKGGSSELDAVKSDETDYFSSSSGVARYLEHLFELKKTEE